MKYRLIELTLIILGLSTSLFGQSTEWNFGFEEWDLEDTSPDLWHDTTVVENRVGLFPPKWHYRLTHIPERTGLARTTDATEGNYAVALSGFYQYQVMRIISGESQHKPGWPIDFKPMTLIGDYKSILLGDCDSLRTYVDVYLTKYNIQNNARDTIGRSKITLHETNTYTQFELEINYQNENLTPDTVIVVLAKKRFGFDSPPDCLECSHVFFDNLRLLNAASTQNSSREMTKISMYPNPVTDQLFIKTGCETCTYDIHFINSQGQVLRNFNSINNQVAINITDFDPGLYLVKIIDNQTGGHVFNKVLKE